MAVAVPARPGVLGWEAAGAGHGATTTSVWCPTATARPSAPRGPAWPWTGGGSHCLCRDAT